MGEHTHIRRRVGSATVTVGGLTLAYMITANAYGWPSLSIVNLLTLIMGAALLVGTMSTIRAMNWCIALYVTVAIGVGIAMPVIEPWVITKAALRAEPVTHAVRSGYQLFLVAFLVWVYRMLRGPRMLEAMRAHRVATARPWVAFALGGLFVVGWGALEYQYRYSEEALTARTQARLQHGINRAYEVLHLVASEHRVTAVMEAYGPDSVETVTVDWGGLPPINPWIGPATEPCSAADDREHC